ncbi:MAG: hypothetical protein R3B06_03400 [Kofleriaceae bacterium]
MRTNSSLRSPTLAVVGLLAILGSCSGGDGPKVGKFIRARAPSAGVAPMAADVSCVNSADVSCTNAAAAAACTVTTGCDADHHCIFARSPDPGCPCYAGEVRWCSGGSKVQFCAATAPGGKQTAWQPTCGPTAVECDTGIPDCHAGTRQTRFDLDKGAWEEDASLPCVPTTRCPTVGETATCTPADPACAYGQRTYGAAGWGPCVAVCGPPPPPPVCAAGERQGCSVDGCGGTRTCIGGQGWSDCQAPRPCPDGWRWDGAACTWTSPNQPSYVKYYPHRSDNERVAATGPIGYPAAGGQPGPIYVEVSLDQWSNPPAGDGGNYCGKDGFVSAWVGCIHPDGSRNFGVNAGRDVADHEWQDKVTIPVRCDPGDQIGVFKHSWGHLSAWHCTRQLALLVIRNHDPIAACRW